MKLYKILQLVTRIFVVLYVLVLLNLKFSMLNRSMSQFVENLVISPLTILAMANLLIGLSQWFKYRKDNEKNKPWFILCVVYGLCVLVLLSIYPLLLPMHAIDPRDASSM